MEGAMKLEIRLRLLAIVLSVGGLACGWRGAAAASNGIGETAHFWYRLAPKDGPYIDTQRGNQAFGLGEGKIHFSEDNGHTWPHTAAFPEAGTINFSCILQNGNVVF